MDKLLGRHTAFESCLFQAAQSSILPYCTLICPCIAFKIFRLALNEWTSPLRNIRGPPNPSFFYGNQRQLFEAENTVTEEKWIEEYGSTFKYTGFFGSNALYVADTKAVNHILTETHVYQKPSWLQYIFIRILGAGLVVVEGDKHQKQACRRRIMNPAFGSPQIRDLTGIFVEKAVELRDIWLEESMRNKEANSRIDVLAWLRKLTLDVIGLAGFGYKFDALKTDSNELHQAFSTIFRSANRVNPHQLLRGFFPFLRPILERLPDRQDVAAQNAIKNANRIGNELMRSSEAALMMHDSNGKAEKNSWKGRDLLSLLLRANLATDLPPSQRMSDEEVMDRALSTTWALFALAQYPDIQEKLRRELLSVKTDYPSFDELNALPYLDMFVRESLRLLGPVVATTRVAVQDSVLPLGKPIQGKDGKVLHEILIRKGDNVHIPVLMINSDKEIWGEDAATFRPARWQNIPEAASAIPGVWGHLLTFIGGPRACIGFRFALAEMKALLFTLVRAFEFELAVPVADIKSSGQRPSLRSEPSVGVQMPLKLEAFQHN
ncbi:hypothetical protein NLJ89_g2526 [Agrocybe chaxingu]|uniref:Cytochrome P450 n=1 Tax=Agrocybe chaxingu TaxID=84603 RepID=A0A9W8K482_9AGAR|nr:hypothetical protein NLJ89_g2526 [Agrocybe chaxingu]